jgi:NTE family protein
VYYFARQEPSPALFSLPVSLRDTTTSAQEVPASLINPLPMNFAFMNIFSSYTAQCGGNFDKLFVPYRCVASDVEAGHKVVHKSGDLGDAIRTSMSFPIVFQPIKIDGKLLYDGGIFDNFPVDVMTTDFAPDIIIGVVVSSGQGDKPQTSLLRLDMTTPWE